MLWLGTWSSCSFSCGSEELRRNGLEPPPRNLWKRRRSEEKPPATPAGALGGARGSSVLPGTHKSESHPPSGPESRRPEVSESSWSRPRPHSGSQNLDSDTLEHARGPTLSTNPTGWRVTGTPCLAHSTVMHCKHGGIRPCSSNISCNAPGIADSLPGSHILRCRASGSIATRRVQLASFRVK